MPSILLLASFGCVPQSGLMAATCPEEAGVRVELNDRSLGFSAMDVLAASDTSLRDVPLQISPKYIDVFEVQGVDITYTFQPIENERARQVRFGRNEQPGIITCLSGQGLEFDAVLDVVMKWADGESATLTSEATLQATGTRPERVLVRWDPKGAVLENDSTRDALLEASETLDCSVDFTLNGPSGTWDEEAGSLGLNADCPDRSQGSTIAAWGEGGDDTVEPDR